MKVFDLIAEDLTHLGGPMGTEYTTESPIGLFGDAEEAKKVAQRHYESSRRRPEPPLKWLDAGNGFRTEDLGFVMYRIRVREVK